MLVTVFTPAYNRAYILPKLYASLQRQTCMDFEWLIVDDGSTDDTEYVVKSWLKEDKFSIRYYKKENGGKHTAMNYSHQYIRGELLAIVDSDDVLVPKAIEIIGDDWIKYSNQNDIGIMSYQRCTANNESISASYGKNYYIGDEITTRVNGNFGGDRFEVIRTIVYKNYQLPVFKNERFMSEGWLWRKIALDYKTVYIAKSIYICNYLEGGLTKNGRLFRMKNPYGMMENCKSFFIPQVKWFVQIKEMLAFGTYGFCAEMPIFKIAKNSGRFFLELLILPFSFILYKRWSFVNGFKKQ